MSLFDLERRLSTDRCKDLFTMNPRVCLKNYTKKTMSIDIPDYSRVSVCL